MIISDLNYLESAEATITGGWYYDNYISVKFKDKKEIDIQETVNIQKFLFTESYVFGTSALAQASSDAEGPNTNAEAFSATETKPGQSGAVSLSIAQSNGAYHYYV